MCSQCKIQRVKFNVIANVLINAMKQDMEVFLTKCSKCFSIWQLSFLLSNYSLNSLYEIYSRF